MEYIKKTPKTPAEIIAMGKTVVKKLQNDTNKAYTQCTKAIRNTLKGHHFICWQNVGWQGQVIIAEAKQIDGEIVKGRIALYTFDNRENQQLNYMISILEQALINLLEITHLAIISKADFDRLYMAANNIASDYQRQLNEFSDVVENVLDNSKNQ